MKQIAFVVLSLISLLCVSQSWDSQRLPHHITIELWPDGAPTDNGVDYAHLSTDNNRDIKPQMHVFLPHGEQPHRAVIICPGGAYGGLAMYHEGFEWTEYFTSHDIALATTLPPSCCSIGCLTGTMRYRPKMYMRLSDSLRRMPASGTSTLPTSASWDRRQVDIWHRQSPLMLQSGFARHSRFCSILSSPPTPLSLITGRAAT